LINTSQVLPGQLVISRAGRDIGRCFIVIDIIDNQYVSLIDGYLRKVEKPKKKKIKHLAKTDLISEFVVDKLNKGEKITNLMARCEIEKLEAKSNFC